MWLKKNVAFENEKKREKKGYHKKSHIYIWGTILVLNDLKRDFSPKRLNGRRSSRILQVRSIGQVQIVEVITTVRLEEPHYARNHDDCQMKGERGFDNSPQMRVALVGTLRLIWAVGTDRHVRAGRFWSHYGCEDLDSILAIAATEKN